MKNTISLILILALLLSNITGCVFAEEASLRSSNYFTSYGTSLGAPGGGGITISFKAVGTGICNQIGVASYQVFRVNDDGDWNPVSGLLSGQTGSNVASYTFGRYFQGIAGETYVVQVSFLCTINNSTEIKTHTSGQVTAE